MGCCGSGSLPPPEDSPPPGGGGAFAAYLATQDEEKKKHRADSIARHERLRSSRGTGTSMQYKAVDHRGSASDEVVATHDSDRFGVPKRERQPGAVHSKASSHPMSKATTVQTQTATTVELTDVKKKKKKKKKRRDTGESKAKSGRRSRATSEPEPVPTVVHPTQLSQDASDWQQKATAENLHKYQAFMRKQQKKRKHKYADVDDFYAAAAGAVESKMSETELKKMTQSERTLKKKESELMVSDEDCDTAADYNTTDYDTPTDYDSDLGAPHVVRSSTVDGRRRGRTPEPATVLTEASYALRMAKPRPKPRASMIVVDASDWQQKATASNLLKYQAFLRKQQMQRKFKYADVDSFYATAAATVEQKMTAEELHKLSSSKTKITAAKEDIKESDAEEEEEEDESHSESSGSSKGGDEWDSSEERYWSKLREEELKREAEDYARSEVIDAKWKAKKEAEDAKAAAVTTPKKKTAAPASPRISLQVPGSELLAAVSKEEEAVARVKQLRDRVKQRSLSPKASSSGMRALGGGGFSAAKRKSFVSREDFSARMRLYKAEHRKRMRQQRVLDRQRAAEVPSKPPLETHEFKEHTIKVLRYIKQKINVGATFTGMADFGDRGELPLELKITTDAKHKTGVFTGETVDFTRSGASDTSGEGRVSLDLVWNSARDCYEEAVVFNWTQESHGVVFELEFNTFDHECDFKNLYFGGICARYPLKLGKTDDNWAFIAHKGTFDFVCASRRTTRAADEVHVREIIGKAAYDLQVSEAWSGKAPKWVKRASAYQATIERTRKIKSADPSKKAEVLFGKRYSFQPGESQIAELRAAAGIRASITLRDTDPLKLEFKTPKPLEESSDDSESESNSTSVTEDSDDE